MIRKDTKSGSKVYSWLPDGQIIQGRFRSFDEAGFVHFQRENGESLPPQHIEFCHRDPEPAVEQACAALASRRDHLNLVIKGLRKLVASGKSATAVCEQYCAPEQGVNDVVVEVKKAVRKHKKGYKT